LEPKLRTAICFAAVALVFFFSFGCATQSRTGDEVASATEIAPASGPIVLQEFQLGPGDVIEITVWRNDDLYRKLQIGSTGAISYPLAGTVQVGGLSIFEVRDKIAEALSEYLVDPQVGINVVSYESQKILVLGEVNRPGVFQSMGGMSALEGISMAGGFTLDAAPKTVLLIRGDIDDPELSTLNLSDTLKKADLSQNVRLVAGDVLYVPATPIAGVERFFRRIDNMLKPVVRLENAIILEPLVEKALNGEVVTRGIVISP